MVGLYRDPGGDNIFKSSVGNGRSLNNTNLNGTEKLSVKKQIEQAENEVKEKKVC